MSIHHSILAPISIAVARAAAGTSSTLVANWLRYALFTYNEFRFHSDLLARVMGICLTLTLFQLLFVPSDTKTNGMSLLLSSLDASGMGIYILHQIVIILLLNQFVVASFINEHEVIGPILLFCVVFFGCWGVVALINKTKLKFIFG